VSADPWTLITSESATPDRVQDGPETMARYAAAAQHEVLLLVPAGSDPCISRVLSHLVGHQRRHFRVVAADWHHGWFAPATRRHYPGQVRLSHAAIRSGLLVADRGVAVISRGRLSVEVRSPATISALAASFEHYWLRAQLPPDVRGSLLSDLDRHIVTRLSEGATDAAVARELNVSARTVQRYVKRLMGVCGARSRLELGIHLGREELI
jgi:DNA-binding CsgD family transcriptional regulator